jgi:hypothetical protein
MEKVLNRHSAIERSNSSLRRYNQSSIDTTTSLTPGLTNENYVGQRDRPRSNVKTNSNKMIKLPPLPLYSQNKSESSTPVASLLSSIEFNRKTDLGFIVSVASKMVKRLGQISEKLDDMKEMEKKMSEGLGEELEEDFDFEDDEWD